MTNKKPVGKRANTRYLFKGTKLSVETLLKEYKIGDKVVIHPNGRYHSGLPFRRFAGKVAVITEKRGRCFLVHIAKEGKDVVIGKAHIKLITNIPSTKAIAKRPTKEPTRIVARKHHTN